jgi:hypothetical protein
VRCAAFRRVLHSRSAIGIDACSVASSVR